MTISTFEFNLGHLNTKMATRPNGQDFLNQVLDVLRGYDRVVLNFALRSPTPSFADQCIGGLVKELGLAAFKQRISLVNVADGDRPLVKHVVLTRARRGSAPVSVASLDHSSLLHA